MNIEDIRDIVENWEGQLLDAARKGFWQTVLVISPEFKAEEEEEELCRIEKALKYFRYLGFIIGFPKQIVGDFVELIIYWGKGEPMDGGWKKDKDSFLFKLCEQTINARKQLVFDCLETALRSHDDGNSKALTVDFDRTLYWYQGIKQDVINWCDYMGFLFNKLEKYSSMGRFSVQFQINYEKETSGIDAAKIKRQSGRSEEAVMGETEKSICECLINAASEGNWFYNLVISVEKYVEYHYGSILTKYETSGFNIESSLNNFNEILISFSWEGLFSHFTQEEALSYLTEGDVDFDLCKVRHLPYTLAALTTRRRYEKTLLRLKQQIKKMELFNESSARFMVWNDCIWAGWYNSIIKLVSEFGIRIKSMTQKTINSFLGYELVLELMEEE